jgi:iron only hydrogenase large subunit-like protein
MNTKTKKAVVFTNKAKCHDCYRCVRVCPVNAIRMEQGQAHVIPERCIACGTCISECPQQAKTYEKDMDRVYAWLAKGEKIGISIAPSFVSFFDDWEQKCLASALRNCGFSYVAETAVGAYYVAQKTKELISAHPTQNHICSSCPAIVNYIEKYLPNLVGNIVPVVSPMMAHAKMMRSEARLEKVVFVGPCIAKKDEAKRPELANLVDAVLTFDELLELFALCKVEIKHCESSSFDNLPLGHSRLFPLEGGLLKTAGMDTEILSENIYAVSGFEEIRDALLSINGEKNDKAVVIEPLFCKNGCINGPIMRKGKNVFLQRKAVLSYKENAETTQNPENCGTDLRTQYHNKAIAQTSYSDEAIRKVLAQTQKFSIEDELNCGACGYSSCREKAIAVLDGIAEVEMCMPFMRHLAEKKSDAIIQKDPSGIVILDHDLKILHMNPAFKKMFSCTDAVQKRHISYLIDPEPFEKLGTSEIDMIKQKAEYKNYNLVCHQVCYYLKEEKQFVGVFLDITDLLHTEDVLKGIRTEAILQAQELIDHQVDMSQMVAKYLGESAAKGEMLMQKLIKAIENK